jgi:hypothetical protein
MASQDVFISYAHVDNEALLEEHEGWISIFHRALQKRLSQLLGRVATVWWDRRRLTGNHHFDDTIAQGVEDASVMVSIVTPRYLNSDYCRKEVEHFAASRELRVGDRSRLFSCVKTPVERDELFAQMAGKLGYEFFRLAEQSGRFREYNIYDPELKPLFILALEDLAQDIASLLDELESVAPGQATPMLPPCSTTGGDLSSRPPRASLVVPKAEARDAAALRVFLATTSSDVKPVREVVLRELLARKQPVTPEHVWHEAAAGFLEQLDEATRALDLSVHILGASYGSIPEDASASYPVLQLERTKQLAAARPEHQPLVRILWMPREVKAANEKQQKLLEQVRNDPTLGALDEVLEGSEEELKERVFSKLETLAKLRQEREDAERRAALVDTRSGARLSSLPPAAGHGAAAVKKVYVIASDGEVAEQVLEIEQVLGGQGFDVISSSELSEEDSESAREARHQHWLRHCDGCLIFHGNTKVSWVRAQIDEVRKALGQRVERPMAGQAVYLAPPLEGLKLRYQVHFPKLEGRSAPRAALEPFAAQISQAETALAPEGAETALAE